VGAARSAGQCSERHVRCIASVVNGTFAALNEVNVPFTAPSLKRTCRSLRARSGLDQAHPPQDKNG
jgi:hypothetical protein